MDFLIDILNSANYKRLMSPSSTSKAGLLTNDVFKYVMKYELSQTLSRLNKYYLWTNHFPLSWPESWHSWSVARNIRPQNITSHQSIDLNNMIRMWSNHSTNINNNVSLKQWCFKKNVTLFYSVLSFRYQSIVCFVLGHCMIAIVIDVEVE